MTGPAWLGTGAGLPAAPLLSLDGAGLLQAKATPAARTNNCRRAKNIEILLTEAARGGAAGPKQLCDDCVTGREPCQLWRGARRRLRAGRVMISWTWKRPARAPTWSARVASLRCSERDLRSQDHVEGRLRSALFGIEEAARELQ